ncbi:MAG TPA: hypothetical protein VGL39_20360 [Jatrophihabitantaceae bacterium]
MRRTMCAIAALLALAGCTSAVAGHSALGPQPSGPTPTGGTYQTEIGDPRTADLCQNLDYAKGAGNGNYRLAVYPTACQFTRDGTSVELIALRPDEARASEKDQSTRSITVDGLAVVSYTAHGTCYRDVSAANVVVVAYVAEAKCADLDDVVRGVVAEIKSGNVVHFAVPPTSRVRANMCASIPVRALDRLAGGAGLRLWPFAFETFCQASQPDLIVVIELLFGSSGGQEHVTTGGHVLYDVPDQGVPNMCTVESRQAKISDAGNTLTETLAFSARGFTPARPNRTALCSFTRNVAALELDALHLR